MRLPRLPGSDSAAASLLAGAGAAVSVLVFARAGLDAGFDPASAAITLASTGGSLSDAISSAMPGFPSSPLALASLRIDRLASASISRFTPLLNTLLHGMNCALLHRLALRQQPRDALAAAAAAAFFAVTPASLPYLHMAAMRAPLLALSLLLGALLLIQKDTAGNGRPINFIAACVAYAAALMSCAWAWLAMPVLLLYVRRRAGAPAARALVLASITGAWFWLVLPDGSIGSTIQGPSTWTPMRLIIAFVPIAGDLPREDITLFLGLSLLVLLGLGMSRINAGTQSMFRGIVWLAALVVAAPVGYPDPVGVDTRSAYIFLPGAALFLGVVVSRAMNAGSNDLRFLARALTLTTFVVLLDLSSVYAVRVAYRTGRVYEKLDRLMQVAGQNKARGSLILLHTLVRDQIAYIEDCNAYLDLIERCRAGAHGQPLWIVAEPSGSWLWGHPRDVAGLMTEEAYRCGLRLVRMGDVRKLVEQEGVAVVATTDQRAFSVDTHLPRSLLDLAAHHSPAWGDDIWEWEASDASTKQGDGCVIIESGRKDPALVSPLFSWPTYLMETLRIEMKLMKPGSSDSMRFYWESSFAPGFSEDRAIALTLPRTLGTGVTTLEVPLSNDFRWLASGRVTRVRLDPPAESVIEVAAVSFLPAGGRPTAPFAPRAPERISLPIAQARDGNVDHLEGTDCYRATTEDPWVAIETPIDPRRHDLLKVTMSCDAESAAGAGRAQGKIYWRLDAQPRYAEERALPFLVEINGGVRTYTIVLDRHFDWVAAERVRDIRLDPFAGAGSFCLNRIELGARSE